MIIANPMYDAAFKFLIEDNECAKLLLGEIIQQEILECELLNNEVVTEGASETNVGVLKMDFKAKVKTGEKELLVIIEVQKASKETNLLRFRQYLGSQYSNKDNCYTAQQKRIPYPIYAVYILGYTIGHWNEVPIIKVLPKSYDYTLGTELKGSSIFIESLSHEMVIIQTPVLKDQKRSLLEQFWSNFVPSYGPFLEVEWQEFDRKYVSLIRRLQEATMKKEIVELMQRENLLQEEWDTLRKDHQEAIKKAEEAVEMLKIKDKVLKTSVYAFLELGFSKEEVARKLNISLEEVAILLHSNE